MRQMLLMDRTSASSGALWSYIERYSVPLVRIIAANVSRATTIAPTSGIVTEAILDCTTNGATTRVDCCRFQFVTATFFA